MDESVDKIVSRSIPYWDWTSDASVPELAQSGEWAQGPVKFGVGFPGHENISARGSGYLEVFDETFTKHMQKLTQTSYCSHCFEEYQFLIQFPHNLVHNGFHGTNHSNKNTTSNMEDTSISSYDPVFFMHHMMVDRQYAYYQALQEFRGIQISHPENPKMPPFSGVLNQLSSGEPSNVPNNCTITKHNSRPNEGLKYENVFNYKYDSLTFKGVTPKEFDSTTKCGKNTTSAGVHFRASKPSTFEIFAIKEDKSTKVGHYAVLTPTTSNLLLEYDVTSSSEEAGFEANDKSLHFEIRGLDKEGNSIDDIYKPTSEYRGQDGERIIRYHTDHFDKYHPNIRIAKLPTKIEFLKNDGTYAEGVEVHIDGKKETVSGPFTLSSTRHIFEFEGKIIHTGLHMGCFVQVSKHILNE